jgi:uncharacterized protein (DUF849 family)
MPHRPPATGGRTTSGGAHGTPADLPAVVITAAVTGALTVPSQNPAIPVTPTEIIEASVAAHEAGAAVLHLHVRDPETGRPGGDVDLFSEVVEGIRARCPDALIEPSTGGGPTLSMDERAAVVTRCRPELASFNTGSVNVAVFPAAEGAAGESLQEWEREYLEGTRDYVFKNTFTNMERLSAIMREAGTKPSFEAFEVGHLHNIKYLIDRGFVDPGPDIQFTLGVLGAIAARTDHFMYMLATARSLFGEDFTFTAVGAGYPASLEMSAMSVLNGGHVRVGLEDSLLVAPGEPATSNAQLVERAVGLLEALDRRPATTEEARAIFGLRPRTR